MQLYEMREIGGIFIDAVVKDKRDEFIFVSAFGRDTAIQEFIAKLSLTSCADKLRYFSLSDELVPSGFYYTGDFNRLVKQTTRLHQATLFDGLVHVWLYDKLAVELDYANRRGILLKKMTENSDDFQKRLWQTVTLLCPVPLLGHWQSLLKDFIQQGWVKVYRGVGIEAYALDFSDEKVEVIISTWIKSGKLILTRLPQLVLV